MRCKLGFLFVGFDRWKGCSIGGVVRWNVVLVVDVIGEWYVWGSWIVRFLGFGYVDLFW